MNSRLYNLDYLRGLSAIGIMIHHFTTWKYGDQNASEFLGRVGIYGVSLFYILSGLTLFYVYHDNMRPSWSEIRKFVKKRIFRIFPLLWLTVFLTIYLTNKTFYFSKLVLTITGLFSILKWDENLCTGIWSIGNELVFYAFFPLFIYLSKSLRFAFACLCLSIFLVYIYFAFVVMSDTSTLISQWRNYTNPFNQLFLFLSGYLIGYFFKPHNDNNTSVLLIVIGLLIFVFYPVTGNRGLLVYGWARLAFTTSCILICIGSFRIKYILSELFSKALVLLGESSYSIYLLHPIVYKTAMPFLIKAGLNEDIVAIAMCITITLIVSYFTYKCVEKPFMYLTHSKKLAFIK